MSFGRDGGRKVMAPPALSIHGPLLRDDLPGLYARLCAQLSALPPGDVSCAVAGVAADAVAVEALTRLQLAARRQARHVVLAGASADLRELVELMGLSDVLAAEEAASRPAAGGGRTARTAARARGRTSSA